jgi:exopolyphosphatase/guanosine-5'-triphosphate,3'-diphosphate pyrophosphatase
VSLDIGAVRITERFLLTDPPTPEELHAAVSVVNLYLDDLDREHPGWRSHRTLIGVAGTITTVAAVEIGLTAYDRDAVHHFALTPAAAEDVFRTLATESIADRTHNPGLDPARADVNVGGCVVLVAIMRRLGAARCLVSQTDLLHATAASLLG